MSSQRERAEDIVSFKQFREDISDIYGEGNLEMAHQKISWHIEKETDYDGNPITYQFLLKKFKEHITAWNKQYIDNKFLSKEEKAKKKTFSDFLSGKYYKRNFDHFTPKKRDEYLFPDISMKELRTFCKDFEQRNHIK